MHKTNLVEVYQEPLMTIVAVDLELLIAVSSATGHSTELFIPEDGEPSPWD